MAITNSPIINCSGGTACEVPSKTFLQINTYADVEKNIWYEEGIDFVFEEGSAEYDIDTDDGAIVDGRASTQFKSFSQTMAPKITWNKNSELLKRFAFIEADKDSYLSDFFRSGLNVKRIFGIGCEGAFMEFVYKCCAVTKYKSVIMEKATAESEFEIEYQLNTAPEIKKVAVETPLPTNFVRPSFTEISTTVTAGAVSIQAKGVTNDVNVDNTTAPTSESWLYTLYTIDGAVVGSKTASKTGADVTAVSFTGITAGKEYIVAVAWRGSVSGGQPFYVTEQAKKFKA